MDGRPTKCMGVVDGRVFVKWYSGYLGIVLFVSKEISETYVNKKK